MVKKPEVNVDEAKVFISSQNLHRKGKIQHAYCQETAQIFSKGCNHDMTKESQGVIGSTNVRRIPKGDWNVNLVTSRSREALARCGYQWGPGCQKACRECIYVNVGSVKVVLSRSVREGQEWGLDNSCQSCFLLMICRVSTEVGDSRIVPNASRWQALAKKRWCISKLREQFCCKWVNMCKKAGLDLPG